ncbi:hypothetical protein GCM10025875_36820 [Litorihabitans aurantiacus]|uniref:Glycosyltransferase n=1 Tax=Litorihabitans aurantiacus TaxID=1930061 RepID=A0AA37XI01_9MICO|nr:hypothetical protein GCM10025875_36820 [Litorihabitans aurantiacus]
MRILLVTAGSRGDVEPFLALARTAARAGHDVQVAGPDGSGVSSEGVDLVSLGVDYSAVIRDQGVSIGAALRNYRTVVKPIMRGVIVGAARAAAAFVPDVVLAHPKVLSAPLIAAALDIPHVLVELVPAVTPTRAFPAAGTVTADLGILNRLTYLGTSHASSMFGAALDEAAGQLGISRDQRLPSPAATLLPITPTLLERPADWPASVHLTGPWIEPVTTEVLPQDVSDFVAGGPFIYAGFGSMSAGDPIERGRAVISAAHAHGYRVLMATGLGGVDVPDRLRGADVMVVRSVPHGLTLPRASAAMHHGGIGTVQAAARAGLLPSSFRSSPTSRSGARCCIDADSLPPRSHDAA